MRRHRPRLAAAALLALGLVPAPARAADDPIPPDNDAPELLLFENMPVVVVAAGRREQRQQETAASVSVVTADEIRTFGYRSLAETLRGQRSFYLYSDGLNAFAGVRGFLRPGEWNARIVTLVDGRPTREVLYGQTHLDRDFAIPMEAIKRVEVIRGPGSALYGSNAVFGVVNTVTRDGADIDGVEARVEGGTQDSLRTTVVAGRRFDDGWDVMGALTWFGTRGDPDLRFDGVEDAAHNFGRVQDDAEHAYAVFAKARKGDFTVQADLANRERDNRSATYYASFFAPGHMRETRADVSIAYDHEVAPGRSVHALAYYGHYRYGQPYQIDDEAVPGGRYRYVTRAADDWVGAEAHYAWQASRAVHLLVGADATVALFARQVDRDSLSGPLFDADHSFNAWALFAEAEWRATDWLTLVGGVHADHVQRIDAALSPRLAAILSPTDADTIKAMYGRAFRSPNLYERFYASPGFNAPNPRLEPEVVDTYELAWERRFPGGWRTSLNGFLWEMTDALDDVQLPDGAVQTQNTAGLRAYGAEVEVRKEWDTGARFRAHAALTRATNDDDERVPYSPAWIVGVSAAVPLWNARTTLAVEPQAVGPMAAPSGDKSDPSFLTNVVLTARDVAKGLDVQVGVYNIFADDARLPASPGLNYQPSLNQAPTQLLVALTYRF